MAEFNRPNCLEMDCNMLNNFKRFRQEVEIYFMATKTNLEENEVQVARLLNLLGSEALRIYNTFKITRPSVKKIFEAFEQFCTPVKNEVMDHYRFFTRLQKPTEPFDRYYAALRELVSVCDLWAN